VVGRISGDTKGVVGDFLADGKPIDAVIDLDLVRHAQAFFEENGISIITALFHAALPEAYLGKRGVQVLGMTGELVSNWVGHAGRILALTEGALPYELSPTLETVRLFNGPGNNGTTIRNGVTYNLKAGDVVIIPAGTGHWFTKIDDHINYLMVRIDPDKATPPKNEMDSKTWLATPR
jgi:hypothetical protein